MQIVTHPLSKFLLLLLTGVLLLGCKKEASKDQQTTPSTWVTLLDPIFDGNTVTLNWKLNISSSNVEGVDIIRRIGDMPESLDQRVGTGWTVFGVKQTSLVDTLVPYYEKVSYVIRVRLIEMNIPQNSDKLYSNVVSITRDIPTFKVNTYYQSPTFYSRGIIADKQSGIMIMTEPSDKGRIISYDLNTQNQTSIETNVILGPCAFGRYNNVTELYVPRSDRWVYIYNAKTLAFIDKVYSPVDVSGSSQAKTVGVAFRKGKLYIAGLGVAEIERSSLETHFVDSRYTIDYLQFSSDTSSFFLGQRYTNLDIYRVDTNSIWKYWYNSAPTDYTYYFTFLDNPNKIIYSEIGNIAEFVPDASNNYKALPRGVFLFNDYCFDESTSLIYASSESTGVTVYGNRGVNRCVAVYSAQDYSLKKVIPVKGYPQKVFVYKGYLYVLEKSIDYYYDDPALTLEKIPL